jgi:hypothetical protein
MTEEALEAEILAAKQKVELTPHPFFRHLLNVAFSAIDVI